MITLTKVDDHQRLAQDHHVGRRRRVSAETRFPHRAHHRRVQSLRGSHADCQGCHQALKWIDAETAKAKVEIAEAGAEVKIVPNV